MTGTFKMTPVDPLHNLTHVLPVCYMLQKLIHSYSNRLQGLPLNAKTQTILSEDQCCYWPDYIIPDTNLQCAFLYPSLTSYWVEGQDLPKAWNTPRFTYTHQPLQHTITTHRADFHALHPLHTHIIISAHANLHSHYVIY